MKIGNIIGNIITPIQKVRNMPMVAMFKRRVCPQEEFWAETNFILPKLHLTIGSTAEKAFDIFSFHL